MDRRDFLKVLGAAALSVVVPEIWVPPPNVLATAPTIKSLCRVSAPADYVLDIILCGKSKFSEVATFDVVRPDGEKILAFALNTFGGIFRWAAAPGEELVTPLQFIFSGNMTVNVIGMHEGRQSFTVLEPGDETPVIIPSSREPWESHPALAGPSVPDVFKNAWDR